MTDSTQPKDHEARTRAVDPTASFIVQAPAGSGKTELLTQRLLTLLATASQPEEILAITFTRKAAGEMRRRVLDALRSAGNPAPSEAHKRQTWTLASAALKHDLEQGWDLQQTPNRLRILTVDALCSFLARQAPVTSGLGALPDIAHNPEDLYRQAAHRTLQYLEEPGADVRVTSIAHALTHLDGHAGRLHRLLVDLLPRREQWLRHIHRQGNDARQNLEDSLRRVIDHQLARLHRLVPGKIRAEWLDLARAAARRCDAGSPLCNVADFPPPYADALETWRELARLVLTQAGEPRRRFDKNLGFPPECKEDKKRAEALVANLSATDGLIGQLAAALHLPAPYYDDDQWQTLQALLSVLELAAAQLQTVFAETDPVDSSETGRVDYAEIATRACRALGGEDAPTDLALRLDHRIQHILVDEFQDTNRLQIRLLEGLTRGWEMHDGRTLFLVGDPMQSIYRFREADVTLFGAALRDGLGGVRLEPLQLSANFRSAPELVNWTNETFRSLFAAPSTAGDGEAVAFAPSTPTQGAGGRVTTHILNGRDDMAEARVVLELLRTTLREDPQGRIALLARNRSHLPALLALLRAEDIAFRAVEIEPLAQHPCVLDLLAIARAVSLPADRTAWLAVLRAPWCGLTLSDLALLTEGEHTTVETLLDSRLDRLSSDGQDRARRVREVLRAARHAPGRVPLRERVHGIWRALDGPGLNPWAQDAAERFFDLLERFDKGGFLNRPAALEAALGNLYATSAPANARVEVMTIHKAKGLEFDTVILPGLGRKPRPSPRPLLLWSDVPVPGEVDDALLLAPLHADSATADPIARLIERLNQRAEDAETTRVLYVATTRARRRLHLIGHLGNSKAESRSLLARLPVEQPTATGAQPPTPSTVARRLRRVVEIPRETLPEQAMAVPSAPCAAFDRGSETARAAGVVCHEWLCRLSRAGGLDAARVLLAAARPTVAGRMEQLGMDEATRHKAVEHTLTALTTTLEDARGRWLVVEPHREARSEWALNGVVDGALVHRAIDRSFIDRNGVRWIIDYKTTPPRTQDLDAFLDEEQARHLRQLDGYAALVRLREERPIRLGLYFPSCGGWREWAWTG